MAIPGIRSGTLPSSGHGALFCGDTLFSAGCGRLFEGTPAQMLDSLDRLAALPARAPGCTAATNTRSPTCASPQAVEPDNPDVEAHARGKP